MKPNSASLYCIRICDLTKRYQNPTRYRHTRRPGQVNKNIRVKKSIYRLGNLHLRPCFSLFDLDEICGHLHLIILINSWSQRRFIC